MDEDFQDLVDLRVAKAESELNNEVGIPLEKVIAELETEWDKSES